MNARQRRKQRRIAARNEAQGAMMMLRQWRAAPAACEVTLDDLADAIAALREVEPAAMPPWFVPEFKPTERVDVTHRGDGTMMVTLTAYPGSWSTS